MKKILYFSELDASQIDPKTATVHDVAICTMGPARGHGLTVDKTCLEQMYRSATAKGKIVTKLDHKSGISQVCGFLTDFYLDNDKLRGTWTLLKDQPNFAHTWSIIENMHDTCGLSASFTGESEDDRARCRELVSVDFVPHAATGDGGLFSRGDFADDDQQHDESEDDDMDTDENEPMTAEEMLDAILSNQDDLLERLDAVEERQQAILEALDALEDEDDDSDDEDDEDDQDAVLDERGARGGPHDYSDGLVPLEFARPTAKHNFSAAGYLKSPLGSAMESVEFSQKVEALRLTGLDEKTAWCRAAQNLARKVNQSVNLP